MSERTRPLSKDCLLASTLSQLPFDAIRDAIWSILDEVDRRALRSTCSSLKRICDALVVRTLIRIPCLEETLGVGQAATFPFLQHLEFRTSDGNDCAMASFALRSMIKRISSLHQLEVVTLDGFLSPGLPNIAHLLPQKLVSLDIANAALPKEEPACDGDADAGAAERMQLPFFLSLANRCPHLSVMSLLNVVVQVDASCISSLVSLSSMSLSGCTFHDPPMQLQWLSPLTNLKSIEFCNMDDMSHGNHWRQDISSLSTLTKLGLLRMEADATGIAVQTRGICDAHELAAFDKSLGMLSSLKSLSNLTVDFFLMDHGFHAIACLTALTEVNVEGISVSKAVGGADVQLALGNEVGDQDVDMQHQQLVLGPSAADLAAAAAHLHRHGELAVTSNGSCTAQSPWLNNIERMLMREASVHELGALLPFFGSLVDFYLEQLDVTDSVLAMDAYPTGADWELCVPFQQLRHVFEKLSHCHIWSGLELVCSVNGCSGPVLNAMAPLQGGKAKLSQLILRGLDFSQSDAKHLAASLGATLQDLTLNACSLGEGALALLKGLEVLNEIEFLQCGGLTGISLLGFCFGTTQKVLHVKVYSCLDLDEGQEVKSCLELYGRPGLVLTLSDELSQ